MKKIIVTLCVLGAMYSYNVFADKTPVGDGCEEANKKECYVVVITPNGSDVDKEPGTNKWEIID